jgi:hypothetical protein
MLVDLADAQEVAVIDGREEAPGTEAASRGLARATHGWTQVPSLKPCSRDRGISI